MKMSFVIGGLLATVVSVAQAEGYVGASLGRGKAAIECEQGFSCKESANVFKLYAGTKLSEESQVDLVVARLDAFEVAYVRTVGQAERVTPVTRRYTVEVEGSPETYEQVVPLRQRLGIDAIVMAPVFHAQLTNNVSLFLKPGLGAVTATIDTDVNGQSARSVSSIKIKPYVALGLDYAVAQGVRIFGSADWLGYEVPGESGTLRSINLGAQLDF